jgi:RNA-dependent RNA polymerase
LGYEGFFIRVQFSDESSLKYNFKKEVDGPSFIRDRVGGTLRAGIIVGGRRFEFLAYSMSALKEHAVWFMCSFKKGGELVTPDSVRASLGNFEKVRRQPSLYGARLSLAFTATTASVTIRPSEMREIDDIKSASGSCMTDGK